MIPRETLQHLIAGLDEGLPSSEAPRRFNVRAARVGGPEGIKAGVPYRLTVAGEFEEATS